MVQIYNISNVIKYSSWHTININLNGNEEATQNSTYQKEIVSEINDIKEVPEGDFPIN